MTSSIRTHTDEQRRRKTRSQHNEYTHLTAEELCERINHLRKRMGYGDTRVSYQGRGWYHRYTSGLSWPFKERRSQVEESLRRFEERERREEAERPAKEAAERENARKRALVLAADAMLETLKLVAERIDHASGSPRFTSEDHDRLVALIAKAEGEGTVKAPPTLMDTLYRASFRNEKVMNWQSNSEMRHALEGARRFVIDDRMSAFMADLANESFIRAGTIGEVIPLCIRLADSLRVSARLPHSSIWIEYPLRPYQHRSYDLRKHTVLPAPPPVDSELPEREGWLIQQHPSIETACIMHLFTRGDTITDNGGDGCDVWTFPFAFGWMADDSPLPWRTLIKGPQEPDYGREWSVRGDPTSDLSNRFQYMSAVLSGLPGYNRDNVGCVKSPLIEAPWSKSPEWDLHYRYLLTEWTGVLRRVWALLATIDHLPLVKGEVRLTKGFLARGRIRKYLSHHTITLNVPAKKDTRILARQMVAIAHRKRHEVRAHWRDDWRNPPSKRCNPHLWEPVDANADLIRCDICGGRQMHIHKHERGDASLGYVTHDYAVTHPTEQPKRSLT